MDIKIYIACHKKCETIKNKYFYPIQVGSALADVRFDGMLHDDEGDNISRKNRQYCELTAQYWAWQNDDAEYFGLFHYRRYLSFSKEELPHSLFGDVVVENLDEKNIQKLDLLDEEYIENTIKQYDVIASAAVDLKKLDPILKSNYHQYSISEDLNSRDLDIVMDIIKEMYPEYYPTADRYIHGKIGYFCNMFIMKREIFHEYSKWLFSILQEHERRADLHEYNYQEIRVSGHLAERLFGIYFMYLKEHGYRCGELQRTLIENVSTTKAIAPFYGIDNIAVAFAANNYFAPYLACTIRSMLANCASKYNYDILILTEDFSDRNKAIFRDAFNTDNCHVRFVNPQKYIQTEGLFVRGHFGIETYYRLALLDMLPDYEKIVYLDSDIIIQGDISELYAIDLEGKLLAATRDADSAGLYNGKYERNKRQYVDSEIRLDNPYQYFQAGVLCFNLKEFRRLYTLNDIMTVAHAKKWQLLDQDILNVLCADRVKYIDMSWNVMTDYAGVRINEIIAKAPYDIFAEYMAARKHPQIIHYAGPMKPWNDVESDMAEHFWHYARQTEYYETLLYRMNKFVALETPLIEGLRRRIRRRFERSAKLIRMHLLKYGRIISSRFRGKQWLFLGKF